MGKYEIMYILSANLDDAARKAEIEKHHQERQRMGRPRICLSDQEKDQGLLRRPQADR